MQPQAPAHCAHRERPQAEHVELKLCNMIRKSKNMEMERRWNDSTRPRMQKCNQLRRAAESLHSANFTHLDDKPIKDKAVVFSR